MKSNKRSKDNKVQISERLEFLGKASTNLCQQIRQIHAYINHNLQDAKEIQQAKEIIEDYENTLAEMDQEINTLISRLEFLKAQSRIFCRMDIGEINRQK